MTDPDRPDDQAPEIIDAGAASVDTAGAAEALGVSERTVRRYLATGLLSGHRVEGTFGPEWRVSAEALEKLVAERKRGRAVTRRPSDRPAVRTDSAVVRRLDANTAALVELTEEVRAVRALPAVIERLADELAALREERRALRDRVDQAEAQIARLREELAAKRARPWWRRLWPRE